jgi:hypothetical protein
VATTGAIGLDLAGAPWPWLVVLAATGLLITGLSTVLKATVPQDSGHRLEWWRELLAARRERQRSKALPNDDDAGL